MAEVYDRTTLIPESAKEDEAYDQDQQVRETTAKNAAIRKANETGGGLNQPAAHGLNASSVGESVMVRDGGISVEAVVMSELPGGGYRLHTGPGERGATQVLTGNGSVARGDMDTVAHIVASTVRIPKSAIVGAVLNLGPLPSWSGHPWLGESRALVLGGDDRRVLTHTDEDGKSRSYLISYSPETGLSWSFPAT